MIKIDQFEQQNLQESRMKSQLSKELTTEMLDKENQLLSRIHFPVKPK